MSRCVNKDESGALLFYSHVPDIFFPRDIMAIRFIQIVQTALTKFVVIKKMTLSLSLICF